MMKLKNLFENYELAVETLQNWEYDAETLNAMLKYFRISSNAIYPYRNHGKVCFLRLAPIEEKLEKNVLGEMEYINYLVANGYNACKPIKTKDGSYCLKIKSKWGEFFATSFEEVDGIPVEETDYSETVLFKYGEALGKLHELSSRFTPTIAKWSYNEVLDWIQEILNTTDSSINSQKELEYLKNETSRLTKTNENYGLIHNDFEPDSVYFNKTEETISVIDFDDGMYNWYSSDIEVAFESLEDELDKNYIEKAEEIFVKGYESIRPFTLEMKTILPLMKRFNNLFKYARLLRVLGDKPENRPEWMEELIAKLSKSLEFNEKSISCESN